MTLYLVILEDRHTDVHVEAYSTQEDAIERADELEQEYDTDEAEQVPTPSCWIYSRTLTPEGDHIRVEAIELDHPYDL